MPWDVKRDGRCPAGKPWAVVLSENDELVACHATKEAATAQQQALYANEDGESTMNEREVRRAIDLWPDADMEIRADGDGMSFHGYAAVFGEDSEDLGGFKERIDPGAFAKSLRERKRDIRMFLNHNTDSLLASTRAKTLRLEEDDKGLVVEADLPDTTAGRDLAVLLKRGDVSSMSFGFQVIRDAWSEDQKQRTLREVRLFEVSAITGWPAYTGTTAHVRHLATDTNEDPEALSAAVEVLFSDEKLTTDQRDLLIRAINARTNVPVVGGALAEWRERAIARGIIAA